MLLINIIFTHSQREAYMDLVESGGGGGRQEIEEPHVRNVINLHLVM